jgi:hypothetical protein
MFVNELIIEEDLRKELAQATGDPKITHEYFMTIWKILKKGTSNKYPEYRRKDDLLYYKDRLYIPHGGFRKDLMCQYHDHPTSGHPGRQGTLITISRDYWWPNMGNYVKKYVEGCRCQRYKINAHPTMLPMNPIASTTNRPFTQLSVDLITDLPMNDGCDSILVIIDHGLTKEQSLPLARRQSWLRKQQ